jgi:glycosyltransferase involved in cell wall biosynthesis
VLCVSAAPQPYKGLHTAVRALSLLRQRFPEARLRIAGAHQRPGLRQSGYVRWLNRLARRSGVAQAIDWLGPLDAAEIARELRAAGAAVIPTHIENCCTTMQETMAVGTPLVASSAGGLPSLARDEESCLFFAPGDAAMCAHQLQRALSDREVALRLSQNARAVAATRNDRAQLVRRQVAIYADVIRAGRGGTAG